MNNNFLKNFVKFFFVFCFVSFIVLYIINKMGYTEYSNSKKVYLTNENIKRFEEDVSSGKNVSLDDYLPKDVSYQNNLSKIGLDISCTTSSFIKTFVQKSFGTFSKFVEETGS